MDSRGRAELEQLKQAAIATYQRVSRGEWSTTGDAKFDHLAKDLVSDAIVAYFAGEFRDNGVDLHDDASLHAVMVALGTFGNYLIKIGAWEGMEHHMSMFSLMTMMAAQEEITPEAITGG